MDLAHWKDAFCSYLCILIAYFLFVSSQYLSSLERLPLPVPGRKDIHPPEAPGKAFTPLSSLQKSSSVNIACPPGVSPIRFRLPA